MLELYVGDKDAWWNRAVWGKDSLIDSIISKHTKQEIPAVALSLYNKTLGETKQLGLVLEKLDNDKFLEQQFSYLVTSKQLIVKEIENSCESINDLIQLFMSAIYKSNSFQIIKEIESKYRGLKQEELYNFISYLMNQDLDRMRFREWIDKYINKVLVDIKKDTGRKLLLLYRKELYNISETDYDFQLFKLFKEYKVKDYSYIHQIYELVKEIQRENKYSLTELKSKVEQNYLAFKRTSAIIGMREIEHEIKTYALILQHLALAKKYQNVYPQFAYFIEAIKNWNKKYQVVVFIREEYPKEYYLQPDEFSQEIPGENIYHKYKHFWMEEIDS